MSEISLISMIKLSMLQRDGIKKQVDVDGGKLFGLNYFPWAFEAISD